MRERYAAVDRRIPPEDAHHRLISVEGELRLLDLRDESTLDALRIDDEANVGRSDEVLATTQRLSDLAVAWWGEQVHGVAYRSRTTPSAAGNIAFFASAPTRLVDHGELTAQTELLTELIVHDQFSVAFDL